MSFDLQPVTSWIKKYRNLIIAGLLVILLIVGGLMAFTDWLGNWIDWRFINKTQSNINAEMVNVNAINANLVNINARLEEQQKEVNRLNENYNASKEQTNRAREEVNKAETNLNQIQKHDFNGSTLDEANRARCLAFPTRPECGH